MPAVPEPGHGSYFLSNAVHSARRSPDVHLHANAADGEGGEADRGGAPLGNRGQPGEPSNCLARSSPFPFARRSLPPFRAPKPSTTILASCPGVFAKFFL